ncbi:MAG: ribosome small subunit-dependent GTPase A [Treponema sp.]|nr:ribosome small subunit-dependent GTPase A [Treponema sp.]
MNNETEILKGLVTSATHNIITVLAETENGAEEIECRIKGKILKGCENFYNPLAPGDFVIIERYAKSDNTHKKLALVLSVEERRNYFSRFNQKGKSSQLLAANVDLVLCITTHVSPPFRPRFLDRVLLQADIAGINSLIICNKADLEYDDIDVDERLEEYSRIGYKIIFISAKTGEGLDDLRREISGKTCVLTGQSGVGKSSILNALQPGLDIREGNINIKYDRGIHTTTLSLMFELTDNTKLIDTPGVRRFIPDGIKPDELITHLREFAPLAGKCSFGMSCSHKTEPGCKVLEAVNAGAIHEDRYESFLRIIDDLNGKNNDD